MSSSSIANNISGDTSTEGGVNLVGSSFQGSTLNLNIAADSRCKTISYERNSFRFMLIVTRYELDQAGAISSEQKRQELLKALDFPNRHVRVAQLSERYVLKESLSWVWKSDLLQWLQNDEPLFWISGKPASGKSTLMNYLIRNSQIRGKLQRTDNQARDWTFVYHFFDFRAGKSIGNNLYGFLRSLLYQLVKQLPVASSNLQQELQEVMDGTGHWTLLDLDQILINFSLQKDIFIYLFLDGLDEYEGNKVELVNLIRRFASSRKKVCIASRPDPPFPDAFKDLPTFNMETLNKPGIKSFAIETLNGICLPWTRSGVLAGEVAQRAQGVFLWARFAVDELIHGITNGQDEDTLLKRLEAFPSELGDIYSRIIKQKTLSEKKFLGTTLLLITHAHRVLTFGGLFSSLSLVFQIQGDTETSVGPWELFETRLKAVSGGMLDIFNRSRSVLVFDERRELLEHRKYRVNFVQTIHKTVSRYLEDGGWYELLVTFNPDSYANELWLRIFRKYLQENDLSALSKNGFKILYYLHRANETIPYPELQSSDSMESMESLEKGYTDLRSGEYYDLLDYTIRFIPLHALKYEHDSQKSTFPLLSPVFTNQLFILHYKMSGLPCTHCGFHSWKESPVQGQEGFAAAHALELFVKDFLAAKNNQCQPERLAVVKKWFFGTGGNVVDANTLEGLVQISLMTPTSSLHEWETEYVGIIQACLLLVGTVSDEAVVLGLKNGTHALVQLLLGYRRDQPLRLETFRNSTGPLSDRICPEIPVGALYIFAKGHKKDHFDSRKILELLLARGEQINARSGTRGTAINAFVATFTTYDADFVETFVNNGADINIRGTDGNALEIVWNRAKRLLGEKSKASLALRRELKQAIIHLIRLGGINNRRDSNGCLPSLGDLPGNVPWHLLPVLKANNPVMFHFPF